MAEELRQRDILWLGLNVQPTPIVSRLLPPAGSVGSLFCPRAVWIRTTGVGTFPVFVLPVCHPM